MPQKRPFIVIEALDAGGSQTQTNLLVKRLKDKNYYPLQLHFPHEDRATGIFIYEKFLNSHNQPQFSRREQALIYIQDFFSRYEDIQAALGGSRKSVVVSDRFYTSTMAYQTAGLKGPERRKMLDWIEYLCFEREPKLPKPTRVIFLDTPPEISLHHLRGQLKNYHEKLSKLEMFRESYLKLAREQKWKIINSMAGNKQRSIQDIHNEVWKQVMTLL